MLKSTYPKWHFGQIEKKAKRSHGMSFRLIFLIKKIMISCNVYTFQLKNHFIFNNFYFFGLKNVKWQMCTLPCQGFFNGTKSIIKGPWFVRGLKVG
jgi:hypothetical protein